MSARTSVDIRFKQTRLEKAPNTLRLLDRSGDLLLELRGHEIEDAVRAGFVDPKNCHFSMFEYLRLLRQITPAVRSSDVSDPHKGQPTKDDRRLLKDLGISWD